tara:strand:- start:114 stop:266 length:153 start_codon:yes stop_codon:yes gene_type:complete
VISIYNLKPFPKDHFAGIGFKLVGRIIYHYILAYFFDPFIVEIPIFKGIA